MDEANNRPSEVPRTVAESDDKDGRATPAAEETSLGAAAVGTHEPVTLPVPHGRDPEAPLVALAPGDAPEAPVRPPVVAARLHIQPGLPDPEVELLSDEEAERRVRARSRRSFLWGAAAVAGTWSGLTWLGTRRPDGDIPWPFRRVLEINEGLSRDLFSSARLAPEYPKTRAEMPRANGDYGVASEAQPEWRLHLVGLADMSAARLPDSAEADTSTGDAPDHRNAASPAPRDKKGGQQESSAGSDDSDSQTASTDPGTANMEPAVLVTMDDIRALHKTEVVTELKCIEGWSNVVYWAGVRLVDFLRKYPPATKSGKAFDPEHLDDLPQYVSLETPDGAYYVGLDMASALHPQTLLCYEMNGQPLAPEHGAPLRLAIPVKYGIKNIKNIGKIKFTDERPKDYWAERGYDWYAGH